MRGKTQCFLPFLGELGTPLREWARCPASVNRARAALFANLQLNLRFGAHATNCVGLRC